MIFDLTKRKGGGGGGYTLDEILSSAEPSGDLDVSGLDIDIKPYAFYKCPITSFVKHNGHKSGGYMCSGCASLTSASVIGGSGDSYLFASCQSLTKLVLDVSGNNAAVAQNCTNLEICDFGNRVGYLGIYYFKACTALSVIILRKSSIVSLGSTNAFANTPFASGGTGGTIYIPQSLYNHLGDGTSSDYKAASNWSVFDGYGTITWKSIESTHTDPNAPIDLTLYYADGTPIPTT